MPGAPEPQKPGGICVLSITRERAQYTHSVRPMPRIVTHRYDPTTGACPNLCCLPESVAVAILDKLRRESRPTLKENYLSRRRITEEWLRQAASKTLRRELRNRPAYFFLGDFSHGKDASRPANLILPISILPSAAITFTLGDSMTVVEHPNRSVYAIHDVAEMFAANALSDFGVSDRECFQRRFVEVQLWDRAWIRGLSNHLAFPVACGD